MGWMVMMADDPEHPDLFLLNVTPCLADHYFVRYFKVRLLENDHGKEDQTKQQGIQFLGIDRGNLDSHHHGRTIHSECSTLSHSPLTSPLPRHIPT